MVTLMGFAHAFGPCEVLHPVVHIKILSFALVYELRTFIVTKVVADHGSEFSGE